ncbi:MAG: cytochrome P460 family protein [Proteobacteria bacterium]|nr:cytochrome P460 family protein [Pseudomonadota bacterium]MDA1356556.1 cytochrome P460 family protein [Pseudomonadota bacterium]
MIRIRTLMLAALFLVFWPAYISADDVVLERWPEGGHIRVLDPRALAPDEAEKIYDALLDSLVTGYLKSGMDKMDYRAWKRLNTTPYISDQHGSRFVNVYLNDKSSDFFTASADQPMPVGSIVIKDSISAVESGGISRGPLFTMEKMPPGFAPRFGDWRYAMIMPNGKLFGTTGGDGNRAVEFCGECHLQVAERDHLFELPEEFLRR